MPGNACLANPRLMQIQANLVHFDKTRGNTFFPKNVYESYFQNNAYIYFLQFHSGYCPNYWSPYNPKSKTTILNRGTCNAGRIQYNSYPLTTKLDIMCYSNTCLLYTSDAADE